MGCKGVEEQRSALGRNVLPQQPQHPNRRKDVEFICLKYYFSLRMPVVVMAPFILTLENIGTQCRIEWHLCYRFCPEE